VAAISPSAARLEHGVVDVGQVGDVVHPGLGGELSQGDPLAAKVAVQRPAVLDQDHRLAVDHRAEARRLVRHVRSEHREQRHHDDDDRRARDREVVLGDPLLEEVAEHDEQHDVERLERVELTAVHDPHEDDDEREEDEAAEDEIHRLWEDGHVPGEGDERGAAVVQ
jgi:hypothetical protein